MKVTVTNEEPDCIVTTTIFAECEKIIATRITLGKLLSIIVRHDGSAANLIKTVERVRKIPMGMFIDLANIEEVSEENCNLVEL